MSGTPPYSPTTEAVFAALKIDYASGLGQPQPITQFVQGLRLGVYNTIGFSMPATIRWQSIFNQFILGTLSRNAKLAIFGDSTMVGDDPSATPQNTQGLTCPAQMLADLFIANGINSSANNLFGSQGCNNPTDLANKDRRYRFVGASAIFGSVPCMGNAPLSFSGAGGGSHYWRPEKPVSYFEIDWRDSANLGRTFGVSFNGGPETVITTTGADVFKRNTFQLSTTKADIYECRIREIAGTPTIFSIKAWDNSNGRQEITIYNWAWRGATSAGIINNGSPVTANGGRINQAAFDPADYCINEMGAVNDYNSAVPAATTQANTITAYNSYTPYFDMTFSTPPFSNPASVSYATQKATIDAVYAGAVDRGAGVFPFRETLGSFANAVAAGANSIDVHMTAFGNSRLANLWYNYRGK